MKTISHRILEMLEDYQQHYHCKLRLVVNHQVLFSGFVGKCISKLDGSLFKLEADSMMLEELKTIQIALKPLFEMNQVDELFKSALKNSLSKHELQLLKQEVDGESFVLVLIQGNTDLSHLQQLCEQLVEKKILSVIVDQCVMMLMKAEEKYKMKQQLMSMKDTLETELYTKIKMSVSEMFCNLEILPEMYECVKTYRRLCDQYNPSCEIAEKSMVWMLEIIDDLSEQKAKSLMKTLIQSDKLDLDEELITTVHCFLKNNLSISITARELYVHRNTLIYRLDKIASKTGLDIRCFEDALKLSLVLNLDKK